MRGIVVLAGWIAAVAVPSSALAQQPGTDSSSQRGFLARHCTACHNERLKTAGLALDTLSRSSVGDHVAVWEKVVAKLRAGAMPPIGRPQPEEAARTTFVDWLETELDRAAARSPNPGRPAAFHRLNRTEYQNAVRDLLALDRRRLARCCQPTMRRMASTTCRTCCRFRRRGSTRICRPRAASAGWRSATPSRRPRQRPTPSARCCSRKSG